MLAIIKKNCISLLGYMQNFSSKSQIVQKLYYYPLRVVQICLFNF